MWIKLIAVAERIKFSVELSFVCAGKIYIGLKFLLALTFFRGKVRSALACCPWGGELISTLTGSARFKICRAKQSKSEFGASAMQGLPFLCVRRTCGVQTIEREMGRTPGGYHPLEAIPGSVSSGGILGVIQACSQPYLDFRRAGCSLLVAP